MENQRRILSVPIIISVLGIGIGYAIRIMHWRYAMEILLVSLSALVILYSIRSIYKTNKKFIDYVKLSFVVFWALKSFFSIFRLPFVFIFWLITIILFFLWLILEGQKYYVASKNSEPSKKDTSRLLFVISAVIIVVGSVFKILHFPYSNVLIVIGFIGLAVNYIKDIKND